LGLSIDNEYKVNISRRMGGGIGTGFRKDGIKKIIIS
jgi:hypothetical protein